MTKIEQNNEKNPQNRLEKVEIKKNNGNFYFTGHVTYDPYDENKIVIRTNRGETLRFEKSQVMSRLEIT